MDDLAMAHFPLWTLPNIFLLSQLCFWLWRRTIKMPEFQICTDFVIPKIVMSQAHDDDQLCKCHLSAGPEITCSPSPCIYDTSISPPRRRKSSCCGLFPSRSPSPSSRTSSSGRSPRSLSSSGRSVSPSGRSTSLSVRASRKRSASPKMKRTSEVDYGYHQYSKSLLEVPSPYDYGDASSDDLSSEWDSDVSEIPATPSKVRILYWSTYLLLRIISYIYIAYHNLWIRF